MGALYNRGDIVPLFRGHWVKLIRGPWCGPFDEFSYVVRGLYWRQC